MAQAVQIMGSLLITAGIKLSSYFKDLYRLDVRAVVRYGKQQEFSSSPLVLCPLLLPFRSLGSWGMVLHCGHLHVVVYLTASLVPTFLFEHLLQLLAACCL
jgi:hypothetical protein